MRNRLFGNPQKLAANISHHGGVLLLRLCGKGIALHYRFIQHGVHYLLKGGDSAAQHQVNNRNPFRDQHPRVADQKTLLMPQPGDISRQLGVQNTRFFHAKFPPGLEAAVSFSSPLA